jgi:hypothetical protein
MTAERGAYEALREKATHYRKLTYGWPPASLGLGRAASNMFTDDAFLVGAVAELLRTGKSTVWRISIDHTVDDDLKKASATTEDDETALEQMRAYRKAQVELAEALSKAAGRTLMRVDRIKEARERGR